MNPNVDVLIDTTHVREVANLRAAVQIMRKNCRTLRMTAAEMLYPNPAAVLGPRGWGRPQHVFSYEFFDHGGRNVGTYIVDMHVLTVHHLGRAWGEHLPAPAYDLNRLLDAPGAA